MKKNILQYLFLLASAALVLWVSVSCLSPAVRALCFDAVRLRRIVVSSTDIALYTGEQRELTLEFEPRGAIIGELSWSSGGSVEVSGGVVKANFPGSGEVTVSASDAVCTVNVTVIDKPVPPGSDLPRLYSDRLTVVNFNSRIGADYVPETVPIPDYIGTNRAGMRVEPQTLEAFLAMRADALSATGQDLWMISAYRTYEYQNMLFERSVSSYMAQGNSRARAEQLAGQTTQPPGCSEHQLGVSIDLGTDPELTYAFKNTPAGSWVTRHAHEYGFILRYPADKTAQTGISYEAWHFRYVGVEHAAYIYNHSLCLEEYILLQEQARIAAEQYALEVSAEEYLSLGELN